MSGMGGESIQGRRGLPHKFLKSMPWQKISTLPECRAVAVENFGRFLLLKNFDDTHWLIGEYRDLTNFATRLRHDNALRELLSFYRIRIGLRDSDVPSACLERQQRYGISIRGKEFTTDFTPQRLNPVARPVHELKPATVNRRGDREENVKTFWQSQTPQSHHIVEFNNLETLGASSKEGCQGMDYYRLPAVLLAAEFHQRYISVILKPLHGRNGEKLKTEMPLCYSNLYLGRSRLFAPLWSVSKVILERGGLDISRMPNLVRL
jgi:hypothetical protein